MTDDAEVRMIVMKSVAKIINEFREENDRAVAIIGGVNVDNLLRRLIERSLLPSREKDDELLEGDSPLSTFSSRINLCYRMGLIDEQLAQILHMLRKIRNSFAHDIESYDLEKPPHSDRVKEMIKFMKKSSTFETLRKLFPYRRDSFCPLDFRIILSLISAVLEMKLHSLPKTVQLNPASLSWIPLDLSISDGDKPDV